jgi:hypothetical protein
MQQRGWRTGLEQWNISHVDGMGREVTTHAGRNVCSSDDEFVSASTPRRLAPGAGHISENGIGVPVSVLVVPRTVCMTDCAPLGDWLGAPFDAKRGNWYRCASSGI